MGEIAASRPGGGEAGEKETDKKNAFAGTLALLFPAPGGIIDCVVINH